MVSRRQADRFLWPSTRRAMANLCDSSGGRHSRTDLSKHHQFGGPQLVARWQIARVRGKFAEQSGLRSLRSRPQDANANEVAWLRWAIFSAMVSRWTLLGGDSAGFPKADAFRFHLAEMDRTRQSFRGLSDVVP